MDTTTENEIVKGSHVKGNGSYLPDGKGRPRYVRGCFGVVTATRTRTENPVQGLTQIITDARVAFTNGKVFWTPMFGLRRARVGIIKVGSEVRGRTAKLVDGLGGLREVGDVTGNVLDLRLRYSGEVSILEARVQFANDKTFWTSAAGLRLLAGGVVVDDADLDAEHEDLEEGEEPDGDGDAMNVETPETDDDTEEPTEAPTTIQ